MEQTQTFTVIIGQKRITASKKVTQVSQFLHNILSLGFDQEEIQIQDDVISDKAFQNFLQFCQINNYQEPKIPKPIRTNVLEEVIDKNNVDFIKRFPLNSSQFKQLAKVGSYLGSKALLSICAAPIACMIYFKDSTSAFDKKCKEIGLEQKVQFQDQEKFKKLYPFMNNSTTKQCQ